MLTTCPECQTTFRVGQAQLDAKRGLVRCGRCNAVFNAMDTLEYELAVPSGQDGSTGAVATGEPPGWLGAPGASPAPRVTVSPPRESWLLMDASSSATPPDAPPYVASDEDVAATPPEAPAPVEQASTESQEQPGVWLEDLGEDRVTLKDRESLSDFPADIARESGARGRSESDDILLSALPDSAKLQEESKVWPGLGWGLASLILLLLLTGQFLYFLRGPLVSWMPELRPMFTAACAELGCRLPLSRELDRIRIEASSLETDPEQAAHARLRVTFSNRATGAQDWPHFVLKITDVRNEALAQRVFKPSDYLPEDRPPGAGMAALSEMEFRLDLDLGSLSAAGYEVKALYP